MANRSTPAPAPALLVGEAQEDWTGDAVFHEYSAAADPIGNGSVRPVPVHRFPAQLHSGGGSRVVPLDLSAELGVDRAATSPALLASFVVLVPGASVVTRPDATSELYCCIEGAGQSRFDRAGGAPGEAGEAGPGNEGEAGEAGPGVIEWQRGDVFVLPAGCTTSHTTTSPDARLYRVTDAPLLHYLGVTPSRARFSPTRFDGVAARARLAEVELDPEASTRSRISVLLGNAALPRTLTVTHTLWAMLGVLPAGRVQRPHRHQSAALDLITECADGCYSQVGSRLDDRGAIVDPIRVDWEPAGAFVTPPGMWHSHHNESGRPAYLLPIQDAGLHTYLRTLDIQFASVGD